MDLIARMAHYLARLGTDAALLRHRLDSITATATILEALFKEMHEREQEKQRAQTPHTPERANPRERRSHPTIPAHNPDVKRLT